MAHMPRISSAMEKQGAVIRSAVLHEVVLDPFKQQILGIVFPFMSLDAV